MKNLKTKKKNGTELLKPDPFSSGEQFVLPKLTFLTSVTYLVGRKKYGLLLRLQRFLTPRQRRQKLDRLGFIPQQVH